MLRFVLTVITLTQAWCRPIGLLNNALKGRSDSVIATIACCGASRGSGATSVIHTTLELSSSKVSVFGAPTPLVLVDTSRVSDNAHSDAAICACDVLALEVRFADLIERTPHGLGQLLPILRRSIALHALHPQKKLLLVMITDYDGAEVSKDAVSAFVSAELDAMVKGLSLSGDSAAIRAFSDLLLLQAYFLPSTNATSYAAAVTALKASLTDADASSYVFRDGRLTSSASAIRTCVDKASGMASSGPVAASPAEVHAAYQCSLLAEAAAREFQTSAGALRKATDGGLMSDFGQQASALLSDALARFDAAADVFKAGAPVGAARIALQEQLQRAIYSPYRKQLAKLQRYTLGRFRGKVNAVKPSSQIERALQEILSEASASFDIATNGLLPAGLKWSCSYERAAVLESMAEAARAHVETHMVQGLYLAQSGHSVPVDISAHWLLPHPFGRDSRYDPISATDLPVYKPKATTMRLRATNGYRSGSTLMDPQKMVFSDKMMQ